MKKSISIVLLTLLTVSVLLPVYGFWFKKKKDEWEKHKSAIVEIITTYKKIEPREDAIEQFFLDGFAVVQNGEGQSLDNKNIFFSPLGMELARDYGKSLSFGRCTTDMCKDNEFKLLVTHMGHMHKINPGTGFRLYKYMVLDLLESNTSAESIEISKRLFNEGYAQIREDAIRKKRKKLSSENVRFTVQGVYLVKEFAKVMSKHEICTTESCQRAQLSLLRSI
ncbi:hypothetical protein ACFL6Y_10570, partial [Elusimicrobiota bacterium]